MPRLMILSPKRLETKQIKSFYAKTNDPQSQKIKSKTLVFQNNVSLHF